MKKLMLILSLASVLPTLHAQVNRLQTWYCTPSSCCDMEWYVYNGTVQVWIYGTCTSSQISADAAVCAYNCSQMVNLEARAYAQPSESRGDSIGTKGQAIYSSSQRVYWQMWRNHFCDGRVDDFVPPGVSC